MNKETAMILIMIMATNFIVNIITQTQINNLRKEIIKIQIKEEKWNNQ